MNNEQHKQCFIMRGLPGSGKSSIAKLLVAGILKQHGKACVVSADSYFTDSEGNYRFDPTKLSEAHAQCFSLFKQALSEGTNVIVDNTNMSAWEVVKYQNAADVYGYEIVYVATDMHPKHQRKYAERNKHGVTLEQIRKMASKYDAVNY